MSYVNDYLKVFSCYSR